MFDIEEFVSEIRKETALSCTETLLSDDMLEAIRKKVTSGVAHDHAGKHGVA